MSEKNPQAFWYSLPVSTPPLAHDPCLRGYERALGLTWALVYTRTLAEANQVLSRAWPELDLSDIVSVAHHGPHWAPDWGAFTGTYLTRTYLAATAIAALLTDHERTQLARTFCPACGSLPQPCYCQRDD